MARGVAQASLVASFDVDKSDGILGKYWPHVAGVDGVVEFNTADLALRRLWAPDGRRRVAIISVSIYRATSGGIMQFSLATYS